MPPRAAPDGLVVQISASGMSAARTLLDTHAHTIANVSAEDVVAAPDIAGAVAGLVLAEAMYGANARMLASLVETQRTLLDVRA
jgi:hypothetical protein